MALIFQDGFGHYNTAQIGDKWKAGTGLDTSINTTPGIPRTGRGCLQINSAAFGPAQSFGHFQDFLIATAWSCNDPGLIFLVRNTDADVGFNATCVRLECNSDGSLTASRGSNGAAYGSTAPNLVALNNTYNSIALRVKVSATVGTITAWVNGVQVLALTGKNTTCPNDPTLEYANGATLMGPGALGALCYHADVYMLDCSTAPHTDYLGALRIVRDLPSANSSPVQWTPLSGQNFQNVNEVPPDGDTSYNSSGTVGQIDQYLYPGTDVPANSSILMVQHVLDMKVDSGSRSVGSDLNGSLGPNFALSNGYVMYTAPYDVDPSTGLAFTGASLPLSAGPIVTA